MTRSAPPMTDAQRRLAAELQESIPLDTPHPFACLADATGMDEDAVLATIGQWLDDGLARRFGAVVRHQRMGRKFNVMTVWNVETDGRTAEAGQMLASFPQVTHCYERERRPEWPFNLYAMIHGETREECMEVVHKVAAACAPCEYLLLESLHEYKKESLRCFPGGGGQDAP